MVDESKKDPHPGMMGDGTEEQNLNQKGDPSKRISEDEVKGAFGEKTKPEDRNQMFAYCRALGVSEGMLLYPNNANVYGRIRLIGGTHDDDVVNLTLRSVSLAGEPGVFWRRWEGFVGEVLPVG